MTGSPYSTLTDVLRADEAILDAAFTAHTVRHQCSAGSGCQARQVLQNALESIRKQLRAASPPASPTGP